ncbi:hypothetical protein G4G28_06590 [Massilia sp. Dwa41.01b]|uniref:hypothetical protein n=1 Tax=unclassified Massilia TaxID=2609279 RepID=UPI0016045123|nr:MULTISPECIES: hypothetical protein [unclassified Massilia]QNA88253.1 hypothetical protein G4G28_06590 [Massilia sp. Dwa41.01b]QNA99153.1 hypothetical protein G4G31_10315 [Massilia sp. Se16.2.3]
MDAQVTDPVIVSLAAGLCGMLGGFAGAWLARRTEYEKWLRQERNSAFADFLQKMNGFQQHALDVVLSKEGTELDRGIRLSELKVNFESQENLVRLYLFEDDRDGFSATVKELRDAYDPIVKQSRRLETAHRVTKEVRDLFERVLHRNY